MVPVGPDATRVATVQRLVPVSTVMAAPGNAPTPPPWPFEAWKQAPGLDAGLIIVTVGNPAQMHDLPQVRISPIILLSRMAIRMVEVRADRSLRCRCQRHRDRQIMSPVVPHITASLLTCASSYLTFPAAGYFTMYLPQRMFMGTDLPG